MAKTINTPRIGEALQRLLRLQGRVNPTLDERIIPTFQVADTSGCQEPGICRKAAAAGTAQPVALERAAFIFTCPVGIVCVIKSIVLGIPAGSATVQFQFSRAALLTLSTPAAVPKTFVDGRIASPLNTGATLFAGASLPTLPAPQFLLLAAATTGSPVNPNDWVIGDGLAPGVLEMQSAGAVNTSMQIAIEWEEYQVV